MEVNTFHHFTVIFEFCLGRMLGYSAERMLADYNIAEEALPGYAVPII